jgi:hypothetical protein
MFNKISLFLMCILFSVYSYAVQGYKDITASFQLPEHMKNCTIVRLENNDFIATVLYVTTCPDQKTATSKVGKAQTNVVESSLLDNDSHTYMTPERASTIEINGEKYIKLND